MQMSFIYFKRKRGKRHEKNYRYFNDNDFGIRSVRMWRWRRQRSKENRYTAAKVLEMTDKIIQENKLTSIMITHNMKDAIKHGNRLVMMMNGNIIYDVEGEEKQKLEVSDLLKKFEVSTGEEFANDRMLLI